MISLESSLSGFFESLDEHKIERFAFFRDENKPQTPFLRASHPELQALAKQIEEDLSDYNGHEALLFERDQETDALFGAFIHWSFRGQAQGGVRFWNYSSWEDFLRDGLRLSEGMTYKNALASLWWGGGKGVIARRNPKAPLSESLRKKIFENYGTFLTSLQGAYIGAEDVGVRQEDLRHMFTRTRFMSCIPPELGGSGNPSLRTANGIFRGIQATLKFTGIESLSSASVIIQGLGNVGTELSQFLMEEGIGRIDAYDINSKNIESARARFPDERFRAHQISEDDQDFLRKQASIFSPCAVGGVLTPASISQLQTQIICGGANNQLLDPVRDDQAIFERGIAYVPDFLVNRMGIINCANEQSGFVHPDPMIERHLSLDWEAGIYQSTLRILERSQKENKPTGSLALDEAVRLAKETHPIWGRRSFLIVQSLLNGSWIQSERSPENSDSVEMIAMN